MIDILMNLKPITQKRDENATRRFYIISIALKEAWTVIHTLSRIRPG
jgi:hypothetical protein